MENTLVDRGTDVQQHHGRMATIGQRIAEIVHGLRGPLTGVLGYSELVLEHKECDRWVREHVEKIHDAAESCERVVQDILLLTSASQGSTGVADLSAEARNAVMALDCSVTANQVALSVRLQDSLPPVRCAPHRLQTIVTNLIENALQAMAAQPRPRALTIETTQAGGMGRLIVQDTGEGIAESELPHIFSPFFTTKDDSHGTGLGLSICDEIAESCGGTISVESRKGQGTTFTVDLPLAIEAG